ncbi:MAG: hypothetical protein ACK5TO_04500 [Planctomycetaceae bacterium]
MLVAISARRSIAFRKPAWGGVTAGETKRGTWMTKWWIVERVGEE